MRLIMVYSHESERDETGVSIIIIRRRRNMTNNKSELESKLNIPFECEIKMNIIFDKQSVRPFLS